MAETLSQFMIELGFSDKASKKIEQVEKSIDRLDRKLKASAKHQLKQEQRLAQARQRYSQNNLQSISRESVARANATQRQSRRERTANANSLAMQRATQRTQERARRRTEALQAQQARKQQAFEAYRLRIFRSQIYGKLSLEQQAHIKRVLMQRKSSDEIKKEYLKEIALIQRRNRLEQRRTRNQRTQSRATAPSSGFGGGKVMGNPIVQAGLAVATVGTALINKGSDEYKELQRLSALTGVTFNKLNAQLTGFSAVMGEGKDKVADIFKDVADRQGEWITDSKFDAKTQQFKGGEGSILANQLLAKGKTKDEVMSIMKLAPAEFIKTLEREFKNSSIKDQTFIFEAFASDLTNLVTSYRASKPAFESASKMSVQFSKTDQEDAQAFIKSLNQVGGSLKNIPLGIFKEFTSHLSPNALALLQGIGSALGKLAGILGTLLASVSNVASVALRPLVDAFNLLLNILKPVSDLIGNLSESLGNAFDFLTAKIKDFIDTITFGAFGNSDKKPAVNQQVQAMQNLHTNPYMSRMATPQPMPYSYGAGNTNVQVQVTNHLDGQQLDSRSTEIAKRVVQIDGKIIAQEQIANSLTD